MKFDPDKILQYAMLRPRAVSEEEKRHGTFNRRMIAATIDVLLVTALASPVIDYLYLHYYGAPMVSDQELNTRIMQKASAGDGLLHSMVQEAQATGHLERLTTQLKWMYYAYAIYSVFCWHYWSATLGKILCRLKVVDAKTGGRMGEWQSILRILGYAVSALPFGLGFLWISLNKKRRGWHDYLAGTEVVRTTSARGSVLHSDSPAPSATE